MRLKNILDGTMRIELKQNSTECPLSCTDYIPLKILLNYSVFTGSGQSSDCLYFFVDFFNQTYTYLYKYR